MCNYGAENSKKSRKQAEKSLIENSGSRKLGVTKWSLSDASASADFPAVLGTKPPAIVEKSCVLLTFAALCVTPRFVTPRFVAWQRTVVF